MSPQLAGDGARSPGFIPRSDDIYIASYPRSGTSLTQMICHQLTSDGSMNFSHISRVMPFLEQSLKRRESVDHLPSPRILKTHLPYRQVSKWPGRYIYVVRDGRDVLISYFLFNRTYFNPGVLFPAFFEDFLAGRVLYGSWFEHVAAWEAHRNDANVLILNYESLTRQPDSSIGRIAAFCGWPASAERIEEIVHRCSISSMRNYEDLFAPEEHVASPEAARGAFIRQGKSGSWKEHFTPQQECAFARAMELRGWEPGLLPPASTGIQGERTMA